MLHSPTFGNGNIGSILVSFGEREVPRGAWERTRTKRKLGCSPKTLQHWENCRISELEFRLWFGNSIIFSSVCVFHEKRFWSQTPQGTYPSPKLNEILPILPFPELGLWSIFVRLSCVTRSIHLSELVDHS